MRMCLPGATWSGKVRVGDADPLFRAGESSDADQDLAARGAARGPAVRDHPRAHLGPLISMRSATGMPVARLASRTARSWRRGSRGRRGPC